MTENIYKCCQDKSTPCVLRQALVNPQTKIDYLILFATGRHIPPSCKFRDKIKEMARNEIAKRIK